jgi:hypothetical protein
MLEQDTECKHRYFVKIEGVSSYLICELCGIKKLIETPRPTLKEDIKKIHLLEEGI